VDLFLTLFIVSIVILVAPKAQTQAHVQFSAHDAAALVVTVRPDGIFLGEGAPVELADLPERIDASRPVELEVAGDVDSKLEHDIISRLISSGHSVAIRIEADQPIRPEQKDTAR
jgi:hypothetical protein